MSAIADDVECLASSMLEHLEQAPCNVVHRFYGGIYVRELTIPKSVFIIGKVHRHPHLNLMTRGHLRIVKEDGSHAELKAPQMFMAPPGRKVAFAFEETVWMNLYPTTETDVEKLEAMLFEESPALEHQRRYLEHKVDDGDFELMLKDIGMEAAAVRAQSEIDIDLIAFPAGEYKVKVGKSRIEGRGIIATSDISQGERICPVRIGMQRTPAGRYLNHAKAPNAEMVERDGNIELLALRPIAGCRGGLDGEEVTVDYRHSYALKKRIGL